MTTLESGPILYTEPPPPTWIRVVACAPAAWGGLFLVLGASLPTVIVEIPFLLLAGWMLGVGTTRYRLDSAANQLVIEWAWFRWSSRRRVGAGFVDARPYRRPGRRAAWGVQLVRSDGSVETLFPYRGTAEEAATLSTEIKAKIG